MKGGAPPPGPVSASQVAGVHPIPLAQEKGIDGGKALPRPHVNKPGSWRPSDPTGSGEGDRWGKSSPPTPCQQAR